MLVHRTPIFARHQSFSATLLKQGHGVAHGSIAQAHILDKLPFADAPFPALTDPSASFMLLVGAHPLGVFSCPCSMRYQITIMVHGIYRLY